MNYNYKRQARDISHRVDKVNGDNLRNSQSSKRERGRWSS